MREKRWHKAAWVSNYEKALKPSSYLRDPGNSQFRKFIPFESTVDDISCSDRANFYSIMGPKIASERQVWINEIL